MLGRELNLQGQRHSWKPQGSGCRMNGWSGILLLACCDMAKKLHVVVRVDFQYGSLRTFMWSRGMGTASMLEKNKMQKMP